MKMYVKTANGGTLNLRVSPNGAVIDKIPNNTLLDVEVDGKWAKTQYNGHTGYVMTEYLVSAETSTITKQQLQSIYNSLNSTLKLIEEVLK